MTLKTPVTKEQALLMVENRDTQILTTRKCFRNLLDVVFLAPPAHLCYCCHGGEKVTEEDGSKMALLSAFPPLRINSQAPRNQDQSFPMKCSVLRAELMVDECLL